MRVVPDDFSLGSVPRPRPIYQKIIDFWMSLKSTKSRVGGLPPRGAGSGLAAIESGAD